MVGVAGAQRSSKIKYLERQTGPAASTEFPGVFRPLSNRDGPPQTETAVRLGQPNGGVWIDLKATNLPREHSAYVRRCAIAARTIPLPSAAPRGAYRISWASLTPDAREAWWEVIAARPWLDAAGAETLHEIWLGGSDCDHDQWLLDDFDALLRRACADLGVTSR